MESENHLYIAVIMTVYNRKDITLKGLYSLYNSIANLSFSNCHFDIYMTDDGSSDGTGSAVKREFPKVNIINSEGNLFWSRGMRLAWQTAIDSKIKYDYYLWFNDDVELYNDGLETLFNASFNYEKKAIISGAFCNKYGNVSYGGSNKERKLLSPNGVYQDIFLMNGNLVLIPQIIFNKLGFIDQVFIHSFGDWDYGCRARKNSFLVKLTSKYVGVCNRHDHNTEPYLNNQYSFCKRLQLLYSDKYSAIKSFIFCKRHLGLFHAIKVISVQHLYVLCPYIYKLRHHG